MSKNIIGVYHSYSGYPCIDGIGAAWAFSKYMKENDKKYKLVPGIYGQKLDPCMMPSKVEGSEIYFLDYTVSRGMLISRADKARKVIIIDHHISAQNELTNLPENVKTVFDVEHSGAVLAWKYFFPEEREPLLLRYIEDSDLNKHEMEYSEEIALFFRTLKMDTPEDFGDALKSFTDHIVTEDYLEPTHPWIRIGAAIKKYQMFLRNSIAGRAIEVELDGYQAAKVNCEPTLFASVADHIMLNSEHNLVWLWSEIKTDDGSAVVQNSIRSNGDVDCQAIAETLGGGGHKNAAGFYIEKKEDKSSGQKLKKKL